MAGLAERIRAGILPPLQGPDVRLQIHRPTSVQSLFVREERGILSHISLERLAADSRANSPTSTRSQTLKLTLVSHYRPIVIEASGPIDDVNFSSNTESYEVP